MKKTILTLSLAIAALSSFAEKRGWYLGPELSMGFCKSFNDNLGNVAHKADFYISEGARAGYMFSPHIGLFSGLGYQTFVWGLKQEGVNTYTTQNYFTIPLYLRLVTSKSSKPGFFMNTGFKFGILTTAKVESKVNGTTMTAHPDLYSGGSTAYFTNPGLVVPIGSRVRLDMGPEFQINLTDNYKEKSVQGNLYAISFRLSANIYLGK